MANPTVRHGTSSSSVMSAAGRAAWDEDHEVDMTQYTAADVNYTPSGSGAPVIPVATALNNLFWNVKTNGGATGDGTTDDTTAVQLAIDNLNTAGGGFLYFPRGTYLTGKLTVKSSVRVIGDGVGATTIKLKNSTNDHLIQVATDASNVEISYVTLDGNRLNQSAGHTLRSAGHTNLWIHHIEAKNAWQYGIGLQAGTQTGTWIHDCYIHATGGDCIDFKNVNDDNSDAYLARLRLEDFGQEATLTTQTGLDMRGPCHATDITVSSFPSSGDGVGIRFRHGELLVSTGLGAHHSTLKGFHVSASGATSIGVDIVARDVQVTDGYVTGALRGVEVIAERCSVHQVTAESCTEGFRTTTDGGSIIATDTVFSSCLARSNTDGFRIVTDNCELQNCRALDNTDKGIQIDAGADNTLVVGGRVNNNNGGNVSDGGTASKFRNLNGYVNEVQNLTSGTFAIDSTGTRTFTVAHGLSVTPNIGDVTLTYCRETNVSDERIGLLKVDAVDGTNVTGRAVVTTASGTASATATVRISVRTKC